MIKNPDGSISLELNSRLASININGETGLFISEEDFKNALKGFKLFESLETLGSISNKIYSSEAPRGWEKAAKGLIRQCETGLFVSQSAIEYLANIFIISGSNDFKAISIKEKDNLQLA